MAYGPISDETREKNRKREAERRASRTEEERAHAIRVQRDKYLQRTYGITLSRWEAMYMAQDGKCGICKEKEDSGGNKSLSVDHDHSCCPGTKSCGKCIRGLLCFTCNQKLGFYETYRPDLEAWVGKRTNVSEIVTVDLDSTLADTGHRHHMIDRENGTDWDAYSAACVDDVLIEGMAVTIRLLVMAGMEVHALSGRKASALEATREWLDRHRIPVSHIWLDETAQGDYKPGEMTHHQYKLSRLREVEAQTGKKVSLHFDDYAEVADLFNRNGVPTVCVRTPQEIEELVASDRLAALK